MKKLYFRLTVPILLSLLTPAKIFAQVSLPESPTSDEFQASDLPGQIVTKLLEIVLPIAGFVTVIIIIISGIQFVTSGGNPEAAAGAKNRLTYAIIGFIIILLAFAILQIINKIFLGTGIA